MAYVSKLRCPSRLKKNGGFNGRFTCQALEKFHLKAKKGSPSPASRVKEKDRKKVIETYQAHERYVRHDSAVFL